MHRIQATSFLLIHLRPDALAEITYFWPTMRSIDGRYDGITPIFSNARSETRLPCGLAYLHFECHVIHADGFDGIVFRQYQLIVGESIA